MLGKGVNAAPSVSSADTGDGNFFNKAAEVPWVLIMCAFKTLKESPCWLTHSKACCPKT